MKHGGFRMVTDYCQTQGAATECSRKKDMAHTKKGRIPEWNPALPLKYIAYESYSARNVKRLKAVTVQSLSAPFK